MDEWRVHVGIKLVRAQMGLDRWNEERADKPANCVREAKAEVPEVVETEEKPKRGRKPKKKEDEE